MNKPELLGHLERIDGGLERSATLCVYGAAPFILLDEPERSSRDIDVAAPYSDADFGDLRQAAEKAGLPINPSEDYGGDHIEWIPALRLCLPEPTAATEMFLWRGRKLSIKTVSFPGLIASKLIRYDPIDQSDIQYVCSTTKIDPAQVETAVQTLPPPFDTDPLVRKNLTNLKADMVLWKGDLE